MTKCVCEPGGLAIDCPVHSEVEREHDLDGPCGHDPVKREAGVEASELSRPTNDRSGHPTPMTKSVATASPAADQVLNQHRRLWIGRGNLGYGKPSRDREEWMPVIECQRELLKIIQEQERLRVELAQAARQIGIAERLLSPGMRAGTAEAKAILIAAYKDAVEGQRAQ